jgi:hypothetical protein
MRRSLALALAGACLATGAGAADEQVLLEKIEQLELRIRDLEANQLRPVDSAGVADWADRVRLGASVDTGFFGGQRNSLFDPDSFEVWDARLFVDGQLGENVRLGERTIFRNLGMSFEWNLVRLGQLKNDVGELYTDFQGFLGSPWLNFQMGRFQIPVGEAYLGYSQGYAHNPFVSNPVGGPWWWDEGVRFYGADPENRVGYVASFSDGETPFNVDTDGADQATLKIFTNPWPWLHLSASTLHSGEIGSSSSPASGALWLGESWAKAFGSRTSVASFVDGVAVADGPNQLRDTWLVGGDAIVDLVDRARLWLYYGRYTIDSKGGPIYDRVLHYWIAELILRGAWVTPMLRPIYLGFRANALGTYDDGEGYLLDFRRSDTLGFNMQTLTAYSLVLGWDLTHSLRLRAEYTFQDIDLVDGVTPEIRAAARNADFFGVEVGANF